MEGVNSKSRESTLLFTKDQRNAYDSLLDFIDADYNENDYKRALVGPAGTGKTFLLRAIVKNCKISFSAIGLSAPTHKACRVLKESIGIPAIKVNTLASDLGLRLNFDIDKFDIDNPPFDPKGRIKIGNYKIYIVDEASMINKGLCMFLEKVCRGKKCKIIYVGDSSQLAPVKETSSSAFKGCKVEELKEIVRQEEDNPIRYLLDLLRYDIKHKQFTFLNYIVKHPQMFNGDGSKGYLVANKNEFSKLVLTHFSDKTLTTNVDYCKLVAFTNVNISNWNKYIRNAVIEDAEKSILVKNDYILSYKTIVNQFNDTVIINSEDYIIYDVVNYIHPTYNLKGFLVRFIAIHGGKVTTPLFVVDHSDVQNIRNYVVKAQAMINDARTSNRGTRAQLWKDYYTFTDSCLLLTNILDNRGNLLFSRSLDYGFALTAHKSQGSTVDDVFVDVNDIVYDKNGRIYAKAEEINRRLYVACSRCRNRLYLLYGN